MTYEQIREEVDDLLTALDALPAEMDSQRADKRSNVHIHLAAARLLLLDLE